MKKFIAKVEVTNIYTKVFEAETKEEVYEKAIEHFTKVENINDFDLSVTEQKEER